MLVIGGTHVFNSWCICNTSWLLKKVYILCLQKWQFFPFFFHSYWSSCFSDLLKWSAILESHSLRSCFVQHNLCLYREKREVSHVKCGQFQLRFKNYIIWLKNNNTIGRYFGCVFSDVYSPYIDYFSLMSTMSFASRDCIECYIFIKIASRHQRTFWEIRIIHALGANTKSKYSL